jgi:Tfp pilus assembly protein PilF
MLAEGYNLAISRFASICEGEGVAIPTDSLNKFVVNSILNELTWALNPETPFPTELAAMVAQGRYLDLQLAPGLRPASKAKVMATRQAVTRYMRLAGEARVIVVTLGLVEAWFDKALGLYLNFPPLRTLVAREPERYEFHVLDYNDIVSAFEHIIQIVTRFGRSDVRFLLTVSPVALGMTFTDSDALVANCYSKSVQRAAAEYIHRHHSNVDYFPSYESVTLSERRVAWREDEAHVSDEAVRLNVVRMMRAYTDSSIEMEEASDEDASAAALDRSRMAEQAAAGGEIEAADRLFAEAIALGPREGIIHLRRATFLLNQARLHEASEAALEALRFGAARYGAHFLLGRIYFRLGNDRASEKHLKEALVIEPGRPGIVHLLGRATARQGRNAEAFVYFKESITASPGVAKMLREFVDLALALGRRHEAQAALIALLDRADRHPSLPDLIRELDADLVTA